MYTWLTLFSFSFFFKKHNENPTITAAPEEVPVAVAAATGDTSDEIPSMFEEKFEDWMAIPGNEAKYEASCENIDEAAYELQLSKLA